MPSFSSRPPAPRARNALRAGLAAVLAVAAGGALAETRLEFRVVDVAETASRTTYDQIVAAANRVLDESGQPACADLRIAFEHVGRFQDPTVNAASITSNAVRLDLLRQAREAGGNIVVLRDLGVCGTKVSPAFAGCAARGTGLTVEYLPIQSVEVNALVWLHEFGHSANLSSLTDGAAHTGASGRLMFAQVSKANTQLTEKECLALASVPGPFRPDPDVGAVLADAESAIGSPELHRDLEAAAPAGAAPPALPGGPEVQALLDGIYVDEVPEEAFADLDPATLDAVAEVLEDPALAPYAPNAILVLGRSGDARFVPPLIAAFDRLAADAAREGPDAPAPDLAAQAQVLAVESVGLLSAGEGSAEGEAFLLGLTLDRVSPGAGLGNAVPLTPENAEALARAGLDETLLGGLGRLDRADGGSRLLDLRDLNAGRGNLIERLGPDEGPGLDLAPPALDQELIEGAIGRNAVTP